MISDEIKLFIDEDTHLALAEAIRKRGYDAVHVSEVKRRGLTDEDQMTFATENKRCFLTFNVGEFVALHASYMRSGGEHYGIIVSAQKPIGRLLREMLGFLATHRAEDVKDQLFFL